MDVLQYQGNQLTGSLLGKLVEVAEKNGKTELDSLPVARRLKSGPEPHPSAEKLDRLLEQSDSDEDSETPASFYWPRALGRMWLTSSAFTQRNNIVK